MTAERDQHQAEQPAGAMPAEVVAQLVPLIIFLAALAAAHREIQRRRRLAELVDAVNAGARLAELLRDPERVEAALLACGMEPPRCSVCNQYPSKHPNLVACQPPAPA